MNKIVFLLTLIINNLVFADGNYLHVAYTNCSWHLPNYLEIDLRKHKEYVSARSQVYANKSGGINFKNKNSIENNSLFIPSIPTIRIGDFEIKNFKHQYAKDTDIISLKHTKGNKEYLSVVNVGKNTKFVSQAIDHKTFWQMFNSCQKTYNIHTENAESIKRYQVEYLCKDEQKNCKLDNIKITELPTLKIDDNGKVYF